MAEHDRVCMTRSIGILPYELDAQGLSPCRRSRMFWLSWVALAEEGVSITKPETSSSGDCGSSWGYITEMGLGFKA